VLASSQPWQQTHCWSPLKQNLVNKLIILFITIWKKCTVYIPFWCFKSVSEVSCPAACSLTCQNKHHEALVIVFISPLRGFFPTRTVWWKQTAHPSQPLQQWMLHGKRFGMDCSSNWLRCWLTTLRWPLRVLLGSITIFFLPINLISFKFILKYIKMQFKHTMLNIQWACYSLLSSL